MSSESILCPVCKDFVPSFDFDDEHYPTCIGAYSLGSEAGREAQRAYGKRVLEGLEPIAKVEGLEES